MNLAMKRLIFGTNLYLFPINQNQNHEAISSKCFEFVSKRVVLDRGIQRKRSIRTSY